MSQIVKRGFQAKGKCQGVMFRQTIIRSMIKFGLRGGASNDRKDKDCVWITLEGEENKIMELASKLSSTKPLNSWGAQLTQLDELPSDKIIEIEKHQVTTNNVDEFKWNENVKFYL